VPDPTLHKVLRKAELIRVGDERVPQNMSGERHPQRPENVRYLTIGIFLRIEA